MPKHKAKKRNLKKRVHRKVQKMKELTAEDLLINPALLQSPQFKALPLEKQIQLVTQMKQLKAMQMRQTPMNTNVGSKSDELYSKYLASNSQLSKMVNENQRLKQQIEENKRQMAEQHEMAQQMKQEEQRFDSTMKREAATENLRMKMEKLHDKKFVHNLSKLAKEADEKANTYEEKNPTKLENDDLAAQDEQTELMASLGAFDMNKAREFFEMAQIQNAQRTNRSLRDLVASHEALAELRKQQAVLQNAFNAYESNGMTDKANNTEQQIQDISDDIEQKKTTPVTEKETETPEQIADVIADVPILPDTVANFQNIPIIPDEISKENIKVEAEQMLMKDKIQILENKLQAEKALKQQEEMANVIQFQDADRASTQDMNERREMLERIQAVRDKLEPLMSDARRNLKGSTELMPYIDNFDQITQQMNVEYQNAKTHEDKAKILRDMLTANEEAFNYLNEWNNQQNKIKQDLDELAEKQGKAGISPNPYYRQRMKHLINQSSPTKLNILQQKVKTDSEAVNDGIQQLDSIDSLYKDVNKKIADLHKSMVKHHITKYQYQIDEWKRVANKAKNSYVALIQMEGDLTQAIFNVENKRYEELDMDKYSNKLQPLIKNDEIDVSAYTMDEKSKAGITDEDIQYALSMKPNDVMNFSPKHINTNHEDAELPTIYYRYQNLTGYINSMKNGHAKDVMKAALLDATASTGNWIFEKGKKVLKLIALPLGGYLLLKVLPPSTTQKMGKVATRYALDIFEDAGSLAAAQVQSFMKGAHDALQPEIAKMLNLASKFSEEAKLEYNRIYYDIQKNQHGKRAVDLVKNFVRMFPELVDAGIDTVDGFLDIAPALLKAAGTSSKLAGGTIKWTGEVVKITSNGLKAATNYITSHFPSSNKNSLTGERQPAPNSPTTPPTVNKLLSTGIYDQQPNYRELANEMKRVK